MAEQNPHSKYRRRANTLERPAAQIKVARLLEELAKRPMMRTDVMQLLCVAKGTASIYTKVLRQQGKVRVVRWVRGEDGPAKPVFGLGPGKDAPRPKRMSTAECTKRWLTKLKKERPAEYSSLIAHKVHRLNERRRKHTPRDPMLDWIPRRDMREAA